MIEKNYNLRKMSTFKIGGNAEYYTNISTKEELIQSLEFSKENNLKITVIGSASNVIISDDGIKGLVIKFNNKNIDILEENDNEVIISVGAGLIWDDLVEYAVNNEYYGIENLSLIPGTVGASAVQNIGAYGQEVCNTIQSVYAYDLKESQFVTIDNKECEFSYRKSIFNSTEKNRYIIFSINYKLNKSGEFSLGYQDMSYFRNDNKLTLKKIRKEIINIRTNKLPDYNNLPNVGSFFKNLELSKESFVKLLEKANHIDQEKASKLSSFRTSSNKVKVPTALLIDICGLKGYKHENIGIYDKHALIVINHSQKGTCKEVLNFSEDVQTQIKNKLGVIIDKEPTVIS